MGEYSSMVTIERWKVRAPAVLATAVVLLGLAVVPLPLAVAHPGTLVDMAMVADLSLNEDFAATTGTAPAAVSGTYLGIAEHQQPSGARVLAAWLAPGQRVLRPQPVSAQAFEQPATMAALIGLGLSPTRMQGAPLPVDVEVRGAASPASLAVALELFDRAAQQDAARGRTVTAIGYVNADQVLECGPEAQTSVAAAAGAGADVGVVPAACGEVTAPGPTLLRAGTLNDVVNQLLSGG